MSDRDENQMWMAAVAAEIARAIATAIVVQLYQVNTDYRIEVIITNFAVKNLGV